MLVRKIRAMVENLLLVDLEKINPVNNLLSRQREIVYARVVYYGLCRELTSLSLASIGNTLGQNHATVLHATNKYELLEIWNEHKYVDVVDKVRNELMPLVKQMREVDRELSDSKNVRFKELTHEEYYKIRYAEVRLEANKEVEDGLRDMREQLSQIKTRYGNILGSIKTGRINGIVGVLKALEEQKELNNL
jgi:hypothetical protein